MKIKHLLLSAIAVATALVSCQKDLSKEQASLVLSDSAIAFESSAAGTKTITLTSNRMWEVQIPADAAKWVSVSPDSGEASADPQTIEITVAANPDNDRTAEISFRIVGGTKKLTVSQKGDQGEAVKGDGSREKPYSVAEALEVITSGNIPSKEVYTKGIITELGEFGGSYGNYTYKISDDASASNKLEVFRGYYIDGAKFTSADQIKVGDVVLVLGTLVYYNNKTPEYTSGSKIVSINGSSEAAAGFSVSTTALSAEGSQTSAKFTINSDVDWTVSTDNPAYVANPASGNGSSEVEITFPANTASTPNIVKITVSTTADVATKSYVITLTHKAADAAGVVVVAADKEYLAANKDGNVGDTGVVSYTNTTNYGDTKVTELRVYKNATLTISVAEGYTIVEVILTCGEVENKKWGFYTTPNCVTVDKGATAAASVADKVATISISGNTRNVIYTASENQMRVENMIVKYKAL